LRIHELRVEFETLTLVRCQQGGKVERHSHSPVGLGAISVPVTQPVVTIRAFAPSPDTRAG
jgi:hypothetical protein